MPASAGTTAPNSPAITSVTDDVSPVTGARTSGASTNDADLTLKVSLTGTSAFSVNTVQLYDGTAISLHDALPISLTSTDITNGFANVQTGTLTNGATYTITA